jgi:hypothetical protein
MQAATVCIIDSKTLGFYSMKEELLKIIHEYDASCFVKKGSIITRLER